MKHIAFSEIAGVLVGNAQDEKAGTGVTVFRFTPAGRAAVEVFGGGPASRETETIATERNHPLNALVFSGGSAYGLAASDGVMRCLEAHGIRPAFTSADGDTIYAIAVGEEAERVAASPDVAGAMAANPPGGGARRSCPLFRKLMYL